MLKQENKREKGETSMNIRKKSNIEESLSIYESDMVNGGEALILIAYVTKENGGMYSYPTPQIFNEEVYNRNRDAYDAQVIRFREEFLLQETPQRTARLDVLEASSREILETENAAIAALEEAMALIEDLSSRVIALEKLTKEA